MLNNKDYTGIKIPAEISIVEKHNGQGYVVYKDDKKMLANALYWAGTTYDERNEETGMYERRSYTPQIYTYKNGTFTLTIAEAAERSWYQGGKLSFWNCTITAEDGKEFLIGINSDALCSLLKNSDVLRGKVQQKIWLGRRTGNVVAYTELMEEFKQAQQDENIRNIKQSVKYEVGQVVGTIKEQSVYCGIWYKYFDIDDSHFRHWSSSSPIVLTVYSQPIPMHVFSSYGGEIKERKYLKYATILNKKPKRIVTDKFVPEIPPLVYEAATTLEIPEIPPSQMPYYERYTYEEEVFETGLAALQYRLDDHQSLNSEDVCKLYREFYKTVPVKIECILV